MASLRSRVLLSVLLLAAAGLVLLAAVTYAEQRSFLQGRVNQEVRGAVPALSVALDRRGFRPPVSPPSSDQAASAPSSSGSRLGDQAGRGGPGGGPNGRVPSLNLPPGTY